MSAAAKNELEIELSELFDIRFKKARKEKMANQEAMEVKKDIKLLTLMFRDDVSDLSIKIDAMDLLEWDSAAKRLVYHKGEQSQYIETASNEVLIRIKPYLRELVKKAKEIYD